MGQVVLGNERVLVVRVLLSLKPVRRDHYCQLTIFLLVLISFVLLKASYFLLRETLFLSGHHDGWSVVPAWSTVGLLNLTLLQVEDVAHLLRLFLLLFEDLASSA